jgi:hypothetical protein
MKKNFVLVDNFYSTPREGFSSHCEIKNTWQSAKICHPEMFPSCSSGLQNSQKDLKCKQIGNLRKSYRFL